MIFLTTTAIEVDEELLNRCIVLTVDEGQEQTRAIHELQREGQTLEGRLLLYDALTMDFQEMKIRWDADCPVCGKEPTITELIDYEQFCGVPARAG